MREADGLAVALDDPSAERGPQRGCRDAGTPQHGVRRSTERRNQPQCVARAARQAGDPGAEELLDVLRERQGLERIELAVETANELQSVERIAAGPFVDAQERLARNRAAGSTKKKPVQRADAQWPDAQALDDRTPECKLEAVGCCHFATPLCKQHTYSCIVDPPERERQR